jgi:hypothetical protein
MTVGCGAERNSETEFRCRGAFPKRCANFGNEREAFSLPSLPCNQSKAAARRQDRAPGLRDAHRRAGNGGNRCWRVGGSKQVCDGGPHRGGQAVHRLEGEIALAAFDVGNVRTVQVCAPRQLFLRQATAKTVETDGFAEAPFHVLGISGGHGHKVGLPPAFNKWCICVYLYGEIPYLAPSSQIHAENCRCGVSPTSVRSRSAEPRNTDGIDEVRRRVAVLFSHRARRSRSTFATRRSVLIPAAMRVPMLTEESFCRRGRARGSSSSCVRASGARALRKPQFRNEDRRSDRVTASAIRHEPPKRSFTTRGAFPKRCANFGKEKKRYFQAPGGFPCYCATNCDAYRVPFESCAVCGYALSIRDHKCRHCPEAIVAKVKRFDSATVGKALLGLVFASVGVYLLFSR